mmetsp:Transcript_71820/g.116469  ORF Transcript_71820/g.116469 Transcript_71820/m.116469 type:complete len:84 (+) Transcript_71820:56-307(+)
MQHLALLSKFRARSSNNPLIYHASSLIALECLALLETLVFFWAKKSNVTCLSTPLRMQLLLSYSPGQFTKSQQQQSYQMPKTD